MANRHKMHEKKAKGGGVAPKHDAHKLAYTGKGSHVEHEAEEEKRGGKVKKKAEAKACGGKAMGRLDKRARGGGVGADMKSSPFSAAHVKPSVAGGNPHPHSGK